MGLALYNETQELFGSNSFRPVIDGRTGGAHEEIIYIRNDDATKYYVGVSIGLTSSTYDGLGENGFSGIGFKFAYGTRRPTEAEWSIIPSGETLDLPDIGTIDAADTYTYHPVWVRVFVPGNTSAGVLENFNIRLYFFPKVVG